MPRQPNRYELIAEHVFDKYYTDGAEEVPFKAQDMIDAAEELGVRRPDNMADVRYYFRFRHPLPASIIARAPTGKHWIIRGTGRSSYMFVAVKDAPEIVPSEHLVVTKVPDATPEIIRAHALSDEQALLALVRYNRLIDIFLGVAAYSMQNHLRTTVPGIGQVEVDEVYLAVDRYGVQYILPTQAKGGSDRIGITQIEQDLAMCDIKFPGLAARSIAAQFMGDIIALLELAVQDERIVVVRESHYRLVPHNEITAADLELFKSQAILPPYSAAPLQPETD
jgi:hypothetical protein